jgi:hypothetical protein
MGCASAWWRCRRTIRCAAAADAHLRPLHVLPRWRAPFPDGLSDLPEAMTGWALWLLDRPAVGEMVADPADGN